MRCLTLFSDLPSFRAICQNPAPFARSLARYSSCSSVQAIFSPPAVSCLSDHSQLQIAAQSAPPPRAACSAQDRDCWWVARADGGEHAERRRRRWTASRSLTRGALRFRASLPRSVEAAYGGIKARRPRAVRTIRRGWRLIRFPLLRPKRHPHAKPHRRKGKLLPASRFQPCEPTMASRQAVAYRRFCASSPLILQSCIDHGTPDIIG
jgi:hypothetical protein